MKRSLNVNRCSDGRHLVPGLSFQNPARLFLVYPAPLFEEKGDARRFTLITNIGHPPLEHRSGPRSALATDDRPMDSGQI